MEHFGFWLVLVSLSALIFKFNAVTADSLNAECQNIEFGARPYPDDNTAFIFCNYGMAQVRRCPTDMCFNEESTLCTADACIAVVQIDKTVVTEYCKNNQLQNVKVPSVSCSHYYVCLGQIEPVYAECPKNTHYSQFEQKCISPAEAKCQAEEKLCKDTTSRGIFAASACNAYYKCENGKLQKKSCDYAQKFDLETGKCVTDSSLTCEANNLPNCYDSGNASVYFPHKNCSKFYFCANNSVFEGQCASGYRFDSKSSSCKEDRTGACDN